MAKKKTDRELLFQILGNQVAIYDKLNLIEEKLNNKGSDRTMVDNFELLKDATVRYPDMFDPDMSQDLDES